MAELILFNKPFKVLSQFTDTSGRATLANYIDKRGFYPAGRLDYDSEGLLLLCDDGVLQQRIAHPKFKLWKTYCVQLEGEVSHDAVEALREGVKLKDGLTRPARLKALKEPNFWDRTPPIRERKSLPTSWIEISIQEGRNRQVRRMCAHVGYPVLRLIRTHIGDWSLDSLSPGQYRSLRVNLPNAGSSKPPRGRRRKR
ncbi:pseudouridine synthase [Congregibacter brevis]|uniref:Pseudouridine synthase n=1 Tax=Congregibacter brevis TaxID=3081201 RepID=A0ABZ0I9Y4_9GAMM|nr:pseudouridine synthase [Congregibacter sp. IMCC45268]